VRFRRPHGDSSVSLDLADATGEPLASVEALAIRPVSADQLRSVLASHDDAPLCVDWKELPSTSPSAQPGHCILVGVADFAIPRALEVERYANLASLREALDRGASPPELVVIPSAATATAAQATDLISAAHETTAHALALLQAWLADERLASSRLVLLTERAIATRPDEDVPDLAHASLWGLVRSAQVENPDRRIALLDIDDSESSRRALPAALASTEPQLALRDGHWLVPRLARSTPLPEATARPLNPEGTVLITGGTGTLGALVARHLVQKHGVKHLLLTSRQGPTAKGAETLKHELEAAGACVTLAACDAADRRALEELLATIPLEHPLTAVLHAAGTLDDGLLSSLTPERLHSVLRTKLDAALHLHELTQKLDLADFVLFSSLSGVLGGPGQSNYAAANAFLDALAHHRKARGLPALALDWGFWAEKSGMTANLTEADLRRLARGGLLALSTEEGLALFDAARARPEAALVTARFDTIALNAHAQALHPLLGGLVRARASRPIATNASALKQRLLSLSPEDRERALLELVRAEVAAVLGLSSPSTLEPNRPLQELGLDSLMAVELRNRLASAAGLRLPATLLFDHPTPAALVKLLEIEMRNEAMPLAPIFAEIDRLDNLLSTITISDARRKIGARLQTFVSKWTNENTLVGLAIASANDDELFELAEQLSPIRSPRGGMTS
jgi:NAD(P)-dependent dehydrogenase (short-subunit alcohol dehydrogenase family)/acyl carrier protein